MSNAANAVATAATNPPPAAPEAGSAPAHPQQPGTPAPASAPPAASEPPAVRDWLAPLADDLRTDPDLNRYETVADLARGMKETRNWARGRIPVPGAEDDAAWTELGEKLRPAKAEDYDIPVPEGDDGATAGRFREFAHETGIPARWAKAIAEFHNREQTEALSLLAARNREEMRALELEYGPAGYHGRLEAVNAMLQKAGIEGFEAVDALANSAGTGKALKALFTLAEKTGELAKVDGATVEMRLGTLTAAQAQAEINRMFNDAAIAPKLVESGSAEQKKYEQLLARVAKGD